MVGSSRNPGRTVNIKIMKTKNYLLRGGIIGLVLAPVIFYFIVELTAHPSGYVTSLPFKYMWLPLLITYGGAAIVGLVLGIIIGAIYKKSQRSD